MSTILQQYKILNYNTEKKTAKEIFDYSFNFPRPDFDFEGWCERLGLEHLPNMNFDPFLETLSENYAKKGIDFFNLIFRLFKEDFKNLEESYEQNQIDQLVGAEALLWYNILADLKVQNFKKFPLTTITVEVAQVEEGIVTLPGDREMEIYCDEYRSFLVRLLSDLPAKYFPIMNWIEINQGDLFSNFINTGPQQNAGVEGIIWGVNEENRTLITNNDQSFFDANKMHWWTKVVEDRIDYWIKHNGADWKKTLQEYPLEVATFTVLIHPNWFNDLDQLIQDNEIYDSTAFYTL